VATELDSYEALVALAQQERELIDRGDWLGLVDLEGERRQTMARLPKRPPKEARRLLEQAQGLVRQNIVDISLAMERTRLELAAVSRARPAIVSYASGGSAGRSMVDHTA
jgi:hypothetical protein